MKRRTRTRECGQSESGYAFLTVVFLAATMLILAAAAVSRLKTQGQREKEEEMIWRGQQYARAIKLYVRKSGGRYPQSVDDLTKAKNQIRFLRQPYKDPLNAQDGSWRMIYVGPQGQIIGSVKQRTAIPGFTPPQGAGRAAAAVPVKSSETSSFDSGTVGMSSPAAKAPSSEVAKSPASDSKSDDPLTGKVFGGNIIGVGSKVDKPSIKVLDGSTNYHEWEFLWDASKDPQPGLMAVPGGRQQTPGTTEQGPRMPGPPGRRLN